MRFTQPLLFLSALSGIASAAPAAEPEARVEVQARDMNGRGTVYQQGGAYGSCGDRHGDGDHIVALGNHWMQNQYKSPHCGRRIRAKNTSNGRTLEVVVADTCAGCGPNDVDFSVGAWNTITGGAAWGVFPVAWDFI